MEKKNYTIVCGFLFYEYKFFARMKYFFLSDGIEAGPPEQRHADEGMPSTPTRRRADTARKRTTRIARKRKAERKRWADIERKRRADIERKRMVKEKNLSAIKHLGKRREVDSDLTAEIQQRDNFRKEDRELNAVEDWELNAVKIEDQDQISTVAKLKQEVSDLQRAISIAEDARNTAQRHATAAERKAREAEEAKFLEECEEWESKVVTIEEQIEELESNSKSARIAEEAVRNKRHEMKRICALTDLHRLGSEALEKTIEQDRQLASASRNKGKQAARRYTKIRLPAVAAQRKAKTKQAAAKSLKRKKVVDAIQKYASSHEEARKMRQEKATQIKSWVQTKYAVQKYKKAKHDVTQIQSLARTRKAVQKFEKAKNAATKIQSVTRAVNPVGKYKKMKKDATQIQSLARTKNAVQKYKKMKKDVTQIQSWVRTQDAVQKFEKKKKATAVIATEARKRQTQKLFEKMQHPLGGQFFGAQDLKFVHLRELEQVQQQLDKEDTAIPTEILQLPAERKKELPQLGLNMIFQSLATEDGEITRQDLGGLLGLSVTDDLLGAMELKEGAAGISIVQLKERLQLSVPFGG